MSPATEAGWSSFEIALIVTGKGERAFLPSLFEV